MLTIWVEYWYNEYLTIFERHDGFLVYISTNIQLRRYVKEILFLKVTRAKNQLSEKKMLDLKLLRFFTQSIIDKKTR